MAEYDIAVIGGGVNGVGIAPASVAAWYATQNSQELKRKIAITSPGLTPDAMKPLAKPSTSSPYSS